MTLDELMAATTPDAPSPYSGGGNSISLDELLATTEPKTAAPEPSYADRATTFLDAMLLGTGDKLGAAFNVAASTSPTEMITNPWAAKEKYDYYQNKSQDMSERGSEGATGTALEIAGGLASPANWVGGPAGKIAEKYPALARMAWPAITGSGAGAVQGGFQGNEFSPGGATAGALTGGMFGAAGGVIGEGVDATRAAYQTMKQSSPELIAMKALKKSGVTPAGAKRIAANLAEAQGQGVPMTILEATDNPTLTSTFGEYASTPRASRIISENIAKRTAGETDRLASAIEGVAPQKEIIQAGEDVKSVAEKTIYNLKQARSEAVAPLYEEALTKNPYIGVVKKTKEVGGPAGITGAVTKERVVPSDTYKDLLETPEVKKIIRNANSTLPENEIPELYSSKRAQTILAGINDELTTAKPNEKRLLLDLKSKLETEIKKHNPDLIEAQRAYAKMSKNIDGVSDTLIGALDNLKNNQLRAAGNKIFGPNVKTSEIENLRAQMGEGAGALRDFAGSYLNDLMKKGDVKAIHKFVSSTANQEKLAAAIGDKEAADVFISIIKNENSLEKMKSVAKGLSGTGEVKTQMAEEVGGVVNKTPSPLSQSGRVARFAYSKFFPKESAETNIGIARAMSNPAAASRLANKISEQYPQYRSAPGRSGMNNLAAMLSAGARVPSIEAANEAYDYINR